MISTFGKPTNRQLLENALAKSQNIQKFAQDPQNFGSGYAGAFGAIAQGLTAGFGAYAEYKQRQKIAENEANDINRFSQFAIERGDKDLASIAGQLTPETRQAYYLAKTIPGMVGGYGTQLPASQREYEYYKNLPKEEKPQYLNLKRNIAGEGGIVKETGAISTLQGYGQAAAQRKGMEQSAQNISDLTYRPLISKETTKQEIVGKKQGEQAVKQISAPETDAIIQQIKIILPQSTSGVIQAGVSKTASLAGISTTMDKADRELQILGGRLIQAVPRFEGPQSNQDVALYKQLAGDIANPKIAYQSRLAAVKQIENLNQKYLNKSSPSQESQKPNARPIKKYNPQTGRIE